MNRYLTIDEEIFLNQFSQGIHSLESMDGWFSSFKISDKKDIIYNLLNMVIQSHPTYKDIEIAATSLGKISSPSAVKMLNKNKPFDKFGYELCDLPEKELLNSFNILLLTLSESDNRRKAQEQPNECNHWWHKDLSDQSVLQKIRGR